MAFSIADNMHLQTLDNAPSAELKNKISEFCASWHGVEAMQQVDVLRDTWRRFWRCLLIVDHDYSRIFGQVDQFHFLTSNMFRSTVVDIEIQTPILRNPSLHTLVWSS